MFFLAYFFVLNQYPVFSRFDIYPTMRKISKHKRVLLCLFFLYAATWPVYLGFKSFKTKVSIILLNHKSQDEGLVVFFSKIGTLSRDRHGYLTMNFDSLLFFIFRTILKVAVLYRYIEGRV